MSALDEALRIYNKTLFFGYGRTTQADRELAYLRAVQLSLSSLLAVIHRDGGHYEQEHGTLQAAKDAEGVVVSLRARIDELTGY